MSLPGKQTALCRCLAALIALGGYSTMADRIEVPMGKFTFSGKGNYVWKADRRDLFQIIHPWTTSTAGDFGQMEAEVAVPAAATPPFNLVFYVMDNNYTGPEKTGADWINRDLRVGHRFRQALVNGDVVWQEDTCLDDKSQHYLVDISAKVSPGQTFKLAFRLWEAVDSSVTMPGDVYVTEYYATKVATATKKAEKDRCETKSYWGDVAIYTGQVPKPEELPWGWQTVLKAPKPELPRVQPAVSEKAVLKLEKAELLDGPWPWPVSQGIPFPMGALADAASLGLAGPDGKPLAAESDKLNTWPDGSLQWALATFTLLPKANGPCELGYGTAVQPSHGTPAHPVAAADDFSVGNGLVSVRISSAPTGPGGVCIAAETNQTLVQDLAPYLSAGGKTCAAKWLKREWLTRSAQSAEFALDGELVAETGERYGTCRLRAAEFADCPYVRLLFTITNQRADEAVSGTPAPAAATGWWLSGTKRLDKTFCADAYGLKLIAADSKPGASGDGWACVSTGNGHLTAVVRWFKHLWSNGIETTPQGIDLQFFKPGDPRLATYNTHPGEAKTQEVWLAVTKEPPGAEDGKKLAALVETPPRLDVSALVRHSQVWGELPEITPEKHPDVYAQVQSGLAAYFEKKCKENIRLFGEYPNWDNYYWNTLHTMYTLYAMTGDRQWFDWAERSVRHHFDVDTCHWQPEKDAVGVVGAMHGYWGDHSDTPCYSLIQNCDGAFDHWNLTGDPDGHGYGVGIAEYVRTSQNIGRGGSSREQGWPIMCMLAAWRQTGEEKYGVHAKLLAETAFGFEERRRGTYIENHGSVSYLGPTPFMYGILCTALRKYHLRTGDERAAILIARLANAVYEESHDPLHSKTLPNIDYYYSPNPYLRGGDGFTPITTLNLNIAAAQAYGAYVTQDAGLADIARRSWLAGLNGATVYPEMAYDLAGIVWWLDLLAAATK